MFFFQMWVKKYRFGQKTQNLFGQFKEFFTIFAPENVKVTKKDY